MGRRRLHRIERPLSRSATRITLALVAFAAWGALHAAEAQAPAAPRSGFARPRSAGLRDPTSSSAASRPSTRCSCAPGSRGSSTRSCSPRARTSKKATCSIRSKRRPIRPRSTRLRRSSSPTSAGAQRRAAIPALLRTGAAPEHAAGDGGQGQGGARQHPGRGNAGRGGAEACRGQSRLYRYPRSGRRAHRAHRLYKAIWSTPPAASWRRSSARIPSTRSSQLPSASSKTSAPNATRKTARRSRSRSWLTG